MQEQDEEWFDDVDEDMLSFKNKIHNWIKDTELERRAAMEQKASISLRSEVSKKSVSRKSLSRSSSKRSPKSHMALKEKLKIAELLVEAESIEKKQSAKINGEKLKLEETFAKSKAKVKNLEGLDIKEGERFHYDDVYSSQQLSEFHGKHYFTTQKDDQVLIGQGSHHGIQQKLQIPRHSASETLASRM